MSREAEKEFAPTASVFLKHFMAMRKRGVEYISIDEVVGALNQIKRHQQLLRVPRSQR